MKNSVVARMSGYLTLYKNIISPRMISHMSLRHPGKSSCFFKALQNDGLKVYSKLITSSENQGVSYNAKRCFSSQQRQTSLMNFDMAMNPNFFNSMRIMFIDYFRIRNLDESFILDEFTTNTKTALEVVSTLLSESRFQDLEGLLTSECKDEVEQNVKAMQPSQRQELAIRASDIVFCYLYDADIITDGVNKERMFIQITVVYHIFKNYSRTENVLALYKNDPKSLKIYNCRFIKEVTKNVDDQWTINAINLCNMYEEHELRKWKNE